MPKCAKPNMACAQTANHKEWPNWSAHNQQVSKPTFTVVPHDNMPSPLRHSAGARD